MLLEKAICNYHKHTLYSHYLESKPQSVLLCHMCNVQVLVVFLTLFAYQVGTTHVTCYVHHCVKNVNIKLSLWDSAGQEKHDWVTPVRQLVVA